MEPPQFPAGPYERWKEQRLKRREENIAEIEQAPANLRVAVSGLSPEQLDTRYKNWTIRQIVHHITDSHLNSYLRFKWALTEEQPTIKPYDEGRWAALNDSRTGDVAVPLALLEALHGRWLQLLRSMSEGQYARSFLHPETGASTSLSEAVCHYAWHGRHHTGQIEWLRKQKGWRG